MYPQGCFSFPDGVLEVFPKEFLTSDVQGLAKAIVADGGFDRLNMLADTLMVAGYENEYVLLHLQPATGRASQHVHVCRGAQVR